MKKAIVLVWLFACSSGTGVDANKPMNALTDAEYVKVCDYFNGQVQSRVGSVCQTNKMKVVSANKIDCAAIGQQLSGSSCTATVGDVERCAQKLDACALLGTTPAECSAISACLQ